MLESTWGAGRMACPFLFSLTVRFEEGGPFSNQGLGENREDPPSLFSAALPDVKNDETRTGKSAKYKRKFIDGTDRNAVKFNQQREVYKGPLPVMKNPRFLKHIFRRKIQEDMF